MLSMQTNIKDEGKNECKLYQNIDILDIEGNFNTFYIGFLNLSSTFILVFLTHGSLFLMVQDHYVIEMFWEVLKGFSLENQKKFLK